MGTILSLLSGAKTYLLVGGLAALIAAAGAGYVVHRIDEAAVLKLQLADATAAQAATAKALATQTLVDTYTQADAVAEATAQHNIITRTHTVTKEIPIYVTVEQDRAVCVPYGFVRVLVSAERGVSAASLDLPAGQSDDACTGLKLSDLAAAVAADYGAANQNAEQLNALIADVAKTDQAVRK